MTAELDQVNLMLSYEIISDLSDFVSLQFEPVGRWFEQYTFQRHQGDDHQAEEDEEEDAESSSCSDEEDVEETPEYLKYLASLDPKNWKEQDHYRVLGLESLRYKATPHQIKKAHKAKVLKHHPDKQKQNSGKNIEKEKNFFACITKAFEQLSNPAKKMSFDSVDPTFKDAVPAINDKNKTGFFKVFGDAFERNERWSVKKKVPKLGDLETTWEDVNSFYNFWYEFDSWREYGYEDEENKETAQDRDERRWIEKQNKAVRIKKKKEEVTRVRSLVDNAYACDPRILKFEQEKKNKKEAEKNKKKEAARLKEEEAAKLIDDARLVKEKLEEEAKQKAEIEKKEKEAQKKLIKKERKNLRTVVKEFDYFAKNDNERVQLMEEIEHMIESLNLNDIKQMNEDIIASEDKKSTAKTAIFTMIKRFDDKEKEIIQEIKIKEQHTNGMNGSAEHEADVTPKSRDWHEDEIRLLVKAIKIFAVGTRERWDVIAQFIEEHSKGKFKRTGKEVLNKTKDMQKADVNVMKKESNDKAFERVGIATEKQNEKTDAFVKDLPSERYTTPGEQLLVETGTNLGVWSPEEQKTLEQALKTFPAGVDRWDKIAECIPTRSKKDCIIRYKELVELIQAKKKAQQKLLTKA